MTAPPPLQPASTADGRGGGGGRPRGGGPPPPPGAAPPAGGGGGPPPGAARTGYLAVSAARVMEYSLVSTLSPRDDRMHGALAPTTMAPSSEPASLVQVL